MHNFYGVRALRLSRRDFNYRKLQYVIILVLIGVFIYSLSHLKRSSSPFNSQNTLIDSVDNLPSNPRNNVLNPPNVETQDDIYSKIVENDQPFEIDNRKFLKDWKNIYNVQKESFYFLIGSKFSIPDFQSKLNVPSSDESFNDLIDLHLYQLSNFENMRSLFRDESKNDELANYVYNVIVFNQNPVDCKKAKILTCNPNGPCGFGCQMHHLLHCLSIALAESKVLLLTESHWHGFSKISELFLPLSSNCDLKTLSTNKNRITHMNYLGYPKKPYKFPAVPSQIYDKLLNFNTNPFLWWVGQLTKYLFRLQPETKNIVLNRPALPHPIVGIHIRRTDKLNSEAKFHDIEEYMYWVELYFKKLEINGAQVKRAAYVATDEIDLIDSLRKKYPHYEFTSNENSTFNANKARDSREGTYGILSDVYYLSMTDYIVCTFSSQVCRLAYEWMNGRSDDASENFKSLDEIYYYGDQQQRDFNLAIPHKQGNITFSLVKKFNLRHNDWNGYSAIHELDQSDSALTHLPSFKIQENWLKCEFRAFNEYEKSLPNKQ